MTSGVGSFCIIRFSKEKKSISEAVRPRIAHFYVSRRSTLTYEYFGKEKKYLFPEGVRLPETYWDRRKKIKLNYIVSNPKEKKCRREEDRIKKRSGDKKHEKCWCTGDHESDRITRIMVIERIWIVEIFVSNPRK